MFNQRDIDIALIEAEAEVEMIFREWVEDYLGGRYAIGAGDGADNADNAEDSYKGSGAEPL